MGATSKAIVILAAVVARIDLERQQHAPLSVQKWIDIQRRVERMERAEKTGTL